ncbi:MAG: hypothetical protein RR894_18745, partial [Terrisporobacter sp.]
IGLTFILVISILIGYAHLPNYALANEIIDENEDITGDRYTYINDAQSILSITNGKANIKSNMTARPGVNKSLITSRLQKKVNGNWQTIEAWTVSRQGILCELNKSIVINKGYVYRIFSTVKAYKGSKSESIAVYSKIVKY